MDHSIYFKYTVRNVNSSLPQVTSDQTSVKVEFNETLFDVNSVVRVNFSSNCTTSSIVDYENPINIPIPDMSMYIGRQCQYSIRLLDSNLKQIGYPVQGTFVPIRGMLQYDTNYVYISKNITFFRL